MYLCKQEYNEIALPAIIKNDYKKKTLGTNPK